MLQFLSICYKLFLYAWNVDCRAFQANSLLYYTHKNAWSLNLDFNWVLNSCVRYKILSNLWVLNTCVRYKILSNFWVLNTCVHYKILSNFKLVFVINFYYRTCFNFHPYYTSSFCWWPLSEYLNNNRILVLVRSSLCVRLFSCSHVGFVVSTLFALRYCVSVYCIHLFVGNH